MSERHLSYDEISTGARKVEQELGDQIAKDLLPPCWVWLGARTGSGYGRLAHDEYAHRWVYRKVWGPIPEGMDVHHTCELPLCVNPLHLRALTRSEHMREHAGDYCKVGHLLDEENTYVSNGRRSCLRCRRAYDKRNRAKRNAQQNERRRLKRLAR